MKRFIIIISAILFSLLLNAQEVITGLRTNPVIKKHLQLKSSDASRGYYDTVYISLPVYDDFSGTAPWPSASIWADNTAFVNADFGINTPTVGVASLDAIDEYGDLHEEAGTFSFEADALTSQPIRLDSAFYNNSMKAIRKSDSIYLSFFYQPQGLGSMPAVTDSLILEFHSPDEIDTVFIGGKFQYFPRWRHIWATPGGIAVDSFAKFNRGYWFKQVVVPVNDSSLYYKKGFRFRFRNIASLATNNLPDWQSNCDQWNIDCVQLDMRRGINDTTIEDIAFAAKAPSLLENYYSMPYHQYTKRYIDEMKREYSLKIANLDRLPQNIQYKMNVRKDSNEPYDEYDGGSYSILPFLSYGYLDWAPITNPSVNFFYGLGTPRSVVFHTYHYLTTDEVMKYRQNDTVIFTQEFSDYYAYDDGTAEAGIGLNGAAGSYAVKFKLNTADTLYGMRIFFNHTSNTVEDEYINLKIWSDFQGVPGEIIAELPNVNPVYSDKLNGYTTYRFEQPILLNASSIPGLIFYAGWSQYSLNNLNVGLDRNTDSHEMRYYNVTGTWQQSDSLHAGSVMIRPIVGLSNPLGYPEDISNEKLIVAPNPVSDGKVNFILPDSWKKFEQSDLNIEMFDVSGRSVYKNFYNQTVELPSGLKGLYLIRLSNLRNYSTLTGKLLIL